MDSLVETWLTLSLKTNRNFFIFTSCTIIGTNWNRCIFCALVRARTECIRQVTSCLILLLNAYLPRKLRLLLKAYFHCYLTPSHPDTRIVEPERSLVQRLSPEVSKPWCIRTVSDYYCVLGSQRLFGNINQKGAVFVNYLCYCHCSINVLLLVLEEHL